MQEVAESLGPREESRTLVVGDRKLKVTVREMTIRKMNQWEAACAEVDDKTLKAALVEGLTDDAILELRNRERATVLPSMLTFEGDDKPTAAEYQDLVFSVVGEIFMMQARVNRRSEVVGETERLIQRFTGAQAQAQQDTAPTNSAPEASQSSDASGLPTSATDSAMPTE